MSVGFYDQAHFTRLFKRHTGTLLTRATRLGRGSGRRLVVLIRRSEWWNNETGVHTRLTTSYDSVPGGFGSPPLIQAHVLLGWG
jgi:hypothetical protein